jgi:hypothetical protein
MLPIDKMNENKSLVNVAGCFTNQCIEIYARGNKSRGKIKFRNTYRHVLFRTFHLKPLVSQVVKIFPAYMQAECSLQYS